MSYPDSAVSRIHEIFERTVESGWNPATVTGASDAQIHAWAARQGISAVPGALHAVLALIGQDHGLWMTGSAFGVGQTDEKTKREALATLAELDATMPDPTGMLVFFDHQSYEFQAIDGTALTMPDPPIWRIVEQETADIRWNSTTEWFSAVAPDIHYYRSRVLREVKLRGEIRERWKKHFDISKLLSPATGKQ